MKPEEGEKASVTKLYVTNGGLSDYVVVTRLKCQ